MNLGRILFYFGICPAAGLAILTLLATMLGRGLPRRWLWTVGGIAIAASVVRLVFLAGFWPSCGYDHIIFWTAGHDALQGVDPYQEAQFQKYAFLHLPPALAVFKALALLPLRVSMILRALLESALAGAAIFLARKALVAQGDRAAARLPLAEVAVLAAAFAISDACMVNLELGQLGLPAMGLILAALLAQGRGRPVLAGVALALATIKINTMLPFLVLFLRRSDRKTWAALALTVAALALLSGPPTELIGRCQTVLHRISVLSQPGAVNDVGYTGPENETILGIEHTLYRLGVRDRSAIALVNLGVVGLMGLGLLWGIWTERLERPLAIAMTSLYATIFLYHRVYDLVMVAPALVYGFALARAEVERSRAASGAVAVMLALGALYMRRPWLEQLTRWTPGHGTLGRLVEVAVLPSATWCILLAMLCLWLGSRTASAPIAWPARDNRLAQA